MLNWQKESLEVDKLRLELGILRHKVRWETIAHSLPILAMLLSVAGLVFAVVQFRSGQENDRMTREVDQRAKFQNQIRGDIDEILRFTRDDKQTVSRVSFLIDDIKTVLQSKVNERQMVSEIFPEYEQRFTENLVFLVVHDCDFTKGPRDVQLANMIVLRWQNYSEYLKREPKTLSYVLYAYTRALQNLRDQNPDYVEGLTVQGQDDYKPSQRYETRKDEAVLYSYFWDIVGGFKMHIRILGTDPLDQEVKNIRDGSLLEFKKTLRNQPLSERLLNDILAG